MEAKGNAPAFGAHIAAKKARARLSGPPDTAIPILMALLIPWSCKDCPNIARSLVVVCRTMTQSLIGHFLCKITPARLENLDCKQR